MGVFFSQLLNTHGYLCKERLATFRFFLYHCIQIGGHELAHESSLHLQQFNSLSGLNDVFYYYY